MTQQFGRFWPLVLAIGCSDDVELLSTDPESGAALGPDAGSGGGSQGGSNPGGSPGAGGVLGGGAGGSYAGEAGGLVGGGLIWGAGGTGAAGGRPGPGGTSGGPGGSGSGGPCSIDADCARGVEWCEAGQCVPCATVLPTDCPYAWTQTVFPRNGCSLLACAPPSACHASADCPPGEECYAGVTCAGDCQPADPSCCEGNFCAVPGCDPGAVPLSCSQLGCPLGQTCAGAPWSAPACPCDPGSGWACAPAEPWLCQ